MLLQVLTIVFFFLRAICLVKWFFGKLFWVFSSWEGPLKNASWSMRHGIYRVTDKRCLDLLYRLLKSLTCDDSTDTRATRS